MYVCALTELERPGKLRAHAQFRALLVSLIAVVCALRAGAQAAGEDILAFRFTLAGAAVAGPVAAAGRIWIVSENKTLYILDDGGKAVGRRPWKDGIPSWIVPDAFGRALLPAAEGSLILVNRAGLEVFRVQPGGAVPRPPVFGSDGRFFAATETRLAAYSANGRALWSKAQPSSIVLGPFMRFPSSGSARISVALRDGTVREFDEYGSQLASIEGSEPPTAWAALGEGLLLLYRNGSAVLLGGQGQELFHSRLGAEPRDADSDASAAWILLSGGAVVRIETDGTVGRRIETGVSDARAIRVFPERVLILGPRGAASLAKDGAVYRDLALRHAPRMPAATASGLILSAGEDWILYAYRFERPLGPRPVPDIGYQSFDSARKLADQEIFWNPELMREDGLMRELRRIENSVGSASIGTGEREAVEFCSAVALGYGTREASVYGGLAPLGPRPENPLPRALACDILGAVGSPRAVPVLTEVYLRDPDSAVRASAAEALGSIGLEPSGEALRAFQWAADREFFLDERGALSTIGAVEGIYRALGELSDPGGLRAVMKLAGKPYGSVVRKRALEALRRLSEPAR